MSLTLAACYLIIFNTTQKLMMFLHLTLATTPFSVRRLFALCSLFRLVHITPLPRGIIWLYYIIMLSILFLLD